MVPVELRMTDAAPDSPAFTTAVDRALAVVHMPLVPRAGDYVQHGSDLLLVHSVAWRFGKAPAGEPADLEDQWFATLVCSPAEAQPVPGTA
jgi:hypothetical protein